MMLRHWLGITLSDELKDKLGEKIEDILIAKKRKKSSQKDVERVLKLPTKKFKSLDDVLKKKIEKLDSDKSNLIIENILDIESLQEVEKY